MTMKRYFLSLLLPLLLGAICGYGQELDSSTSKIEKLTPKAFRHIGARAEETERVISRQTSRYLAHMAKEEAKLQKTLSQSDSNLSASLFREVRQEYQKWQTASSNGGSLPVLKEYLPVVDSIHTALRFIEKSQREIPTMPMATVEAIHSASAELQRLEGTWQHTRDVESFIRKREQQLATQLTKTGMAKKLIGLNRTAFYFQQQLVEYKSLLQDRGRLEEKVLSSLRNSNAFNYFMQKNSFVGQLFSLPDNYGSTASLEGLQTKANIQWRMGLSPVPGRVGDRGADPGHNLQQKVDNGEQQISQLKNKLRSLGNFSGGGDIVMPNFAPNDQRVKSFAKRLVYGVNLQTQGVYGIMPATANLGLLVGYKLNSKATIGVGGSYNIGLGRGISQLSYTGQGASIRSYVDLKARGNLWLTGGLEYNYIKGLSAWRDLSHWDQWQKSALFGLSKKFRLAQGRSSSLQLLFDALYHEHTPPTPPLIFRVGYSFN